MNTFQFTKSMRSDIGTMTELQPLANASLMQAAAAFQPALGFATPAAPDPVSEPMYSKPDERFGELRQVDAIRDLYLNVQRSVDDLRTSALQDARKESALIYRVLDFLRRQGARVPDTVIPTLPVNVRITPPQDGVKALFTKGVPLLDQEFTVTIGGQVQKVKHNDQSALFGSSAIMVDDIRNTEALRHALSLVMRKLESEIQDAQEAIGEIEDALPEARRKLDALDQQRVETLEDYLVAQRLLAEHWQSVEQAYADRQRVIEGHRGLYYVKVRETPLSLTLPDPLNLRSESEGDLVPGCPSIEVPLPEALSPFLNGVMDIPMADWAALRELHPLLPGREGLALQVEARKARLQVRPRPASGGSEGLLGILQANRAAIQPIGDRPFLAASLAELQRQGRAILSLEDLLGHPNPWLRGPAQQLHQRLTAAAGCLLARLKAITPSVRLRWAGAAEADTLAVETPERWPGLAQAEEADFNGVRTVVELVGWWFARLHAEATTPGRTAMRNFVRACLLLAVDENPMDLLHGQVKTLPSRFRLGENLRLDLNREPRPGAVLQLLDESQRVVGAVRVEDHDNQGTLASIVQVLDPQVALSTAFRVSGQSLSMGS